MEMKCLMQIELNKQNENAQKIQQKITEFEDTIVLKDLKIK